MAEYISYSPHLLQKTKHLRDKFLDDLPDVEHHHRLHRIVSGGTTGDLPRISAKLMEGGGNKIVSRDVRDISINRWSRADVDKGDAMSITYQLENPGHPGGFVRRNILEARNLTVMAAASLLGVTRQALSDFLNEKTALTAELALRIETVFGCSMETLMELQTRFEIANARKHQAEIQSELAAAPRVQEPVDRPEPIVKRAYAIG